jgi:hypothetical protein
MTHLAGPGAGVPLLQGHAEAALEILIAEHEILYMSGHKLEGHLVAYSHMAGWLF